MKLPLLFLLALSSLAQTAVFPGAVVTDAQLGVATNNVQTLLSGSITSTSTTFTVVSATGMAANQIATIDAENVWICGVSGLTVSVGISGSCPNVNGRGFDGTSAVAHSATGANCNFGSASGCVSEYVTAWHNNAKNKEIEAVEAAVPPAATDLIFSSFANACANAQSNGFILLPVKTWAAVGTMTCSAPGVDFRYGGRVQPAGSGCSGTCVITLPGNTLCPPLQQCFDLTSSGAAGIAFSLPPAQITPQNVGAKCDGSTDDRNPLNYALNISVVNRIPLFLPGGTCVTSGPIAVISGVKSSTIRGAGSGQAGGQLSVIQSTDTSGAAVLAYATSTGGNPYVDWSGFEILCSGSSSGDGLTVGSVSNVVSGTIRNVRATNCKGSGAGGLHITAAEGITVGPGVMADNDYDGLLIDGVATNNQFDNFQGQAETNAAVHEIGSGANQFNSPLMQSSAYGCILNGGTDNIFLSPWFENNSTNSCLLTNERDPEMLAMHHTYGSGLGMVINNSSIIPPGLFSGSINASGGTAVTLSTAVSGGNVWLGAMAPSNFSGTGATPFREILLGYTAGQNVNYNGNSNIPNNSSQQTLTCGTSCAVDLSANSETIYITLTANSTMSISNYTNSGAGGQFCVVLYNSSSAYTWTWPGSVHGGGTVSTAGRYGQCFAQVANNNWYALGTISGPN